MFYNGKGNLARDALYNILSTVLFVGTLQIVVFPYLASIFSHSEYGEILTLIGIVQTITATCGGALQLTRLLLNEEYENGKQNGDFNITLLLMIGVSLLFCYLIIKLFFNQNGVNFGGLLLYVILSTSNSYYCVYFRLFLDFKKILFQRIFGTIGFLTGLGLMCFSPFWVIPFACSEFIQFIYIIWNSDLYMESFGVTNNFKNLFLKLFILIMTTLTGNLINYLDRLVLFPLLGGEGVAIYSVASYFGKGIGVIISPISGVLLSYYAKKDYRMTYKKFWIINSITLVIGIVFYIIAIILSPFFIELLYPSLFEGAVKYINLANLAAIVSAVCALTQSAVLKYAPTWIQLIKEGIYGGVYIAMGLFMLERYGLYGFCISAVVANFSKLLILYGLGGRYIKIAKNE